MAKILGCQIVIEATVKKKQNRIRRDELRV